MDLQLLKKNIGNRKIVMRWKDAKTEQEIFDQTGLKVEFYVTRNAKRIDKKSSFDDTVLEGKSDSYYIVIAPNWKWNKKDDERYQKMGYKYGHDILWLSPKPAMKKKPAASANKNTKLVLSLDWDICTDAVGIDIFSVTNNGADFIVSVYDKNITTLEMPIGKKDNKYCAAYFKHSKQLKVYLDKREIKTSELK